MPSEAISEKLICRESNWNSVESVVRPRTQIKTYKFRYPCNSIRLETARREYVMDEFLTNKFQLISVPVHKLLPTEHRNTILLKFPDTEKSELVQGCGSMSQMLFAVTNPSHTYLPRNGQHPADQQRTKQRTLSSSTDEAYVCGEICSSKEIIYVSTNEAMETMIINKI